MIILSNIDIVPTDLLISTLYSISLQFFAFIAYLL